MRQPFLWLIAAVLLTGSCSGPALTVRHQVEPIHVTVDVYVKVEKELESFFQFEEEFEESDESNDQSSR